MSVRAESTLISNMVLIGVAVVVSIVMIGYVSSLIAYHRDEVEIANIVQNEALDVVVNVISYDNTSRTLWLLLRRVNSPSRTYFLALSTDREYLNCSSVHLYNPARDHDGIVCNTIGECVNPPLLYSLPARSLHIIWEGVITDFESFAREHGYPTTGLVRICKIANSCEQASTGSACGMNTIVKINVPEGGRVLRIYVIVPYSNRFYIASIYEVNLD